jgi:nucleotide-binding universal stress UspA family protein
MSEVNILVPVDGSPHAMRANDYAIKMAGLLSAEIILLYCHKPFPSVLGEPYLQKAITQRLENSQKQLEPYEVRLKAAGVACETRILEGPPGSRICETARIEDCEMIVMGSRGRTDLQGLLLGSTAHRVLHCAPCPVMVVK